MTFEHDLQTLLHADADRLHPVGRGPAAARARAEQRRRRALAAGLAAVAAVAVAAVPLLALRDDDGTGGIDVATDPTLDAPAVPTEVDAEVLPLDFTWREIDAPVTLVGHSPLTTADGVLYLLSTAPGVTWEEDTVDPLPQAIYRSIDGVTWEAAVPDESVGQLSSLTERDGLLYAVSTAPVVGSAITTSVVTSADGGATWVPSELPTDTTPPDATVPVDTTGPIARLGATPDGALVALVSTTFWPDLSSLLTTAEGEELGWEQRDDGIAIVDYNADGAPIATSCVDPEPGVVCTEFVEEMVPSVLRTVTWNELGLSGRGDLQRRQMFRSADGQTWEEVDDPLPDGVAAFETTSQGILAWTWLTEQSPPRIFRTTDGLAWTEITPPGSGSESVGVTGDRLVVVDGLRVHTSTDAGLTWSSTDLGSFVGSEAQAGTAQVGPMGAAVVAYAGDPGGPAPADVVVLFSPDGVNWSVTVPTVPTGDFPELLAVTENSIVLTGYVEVEDGVRQHAFVGVPDR